MATQVIRYSQAAAFMAKVGKDLYAHAAVNCLMLGICERLVQDPAAYTNPLFLSTHDQSGEFLSAAVMTPPYNLILAEGEDFSLGLFSLIDYLRENEIDIPGVIGPVQCAEAFFYRWKTVSGQAGEVTMYQRVYDLRHVNMPKLPLGHFRIAHREDSSLIASWLQAFELEALNEVHPAKKAWAKELVEKGKMFVWEDDDQPVAMAMKSRPLRDSVTVSAVYTPPEHRRKGYATALVARLSQHLLDMGYEFITLFTDLENPTSNAIYQKIGYRPVIDFRSYKFK